MAARKPLDQLEVHRDLQRLAGSLKQSSIVQFFTEDPSRSSDFLAQAAGLQLDYSKHLLDRPALATLQKLPEQARLGERIEALFAGDPINNTEARPALHSLLRASDGARPADKFAEVSASRQRMREYANQLNRGELQGYRGSTITDVVNIGIGGSDLGPRLVTEALQPFQGSINCHYVANVDPSDLLATLRDLDPGTTLFIICSKSFRTEETLANSLAARAWMLRSGASESDLAKHFLAVTTNLEAATEFGIADENCLPMWDWVGGRYSVWSAVGLSCAIAVGWDNFQEFLAGAEAMDSHFRETPFAENLPVLMSLLELWYVNYFGATNHVVLPYDHHLRKLPDFLQQLTMESNGKRVSEDGQALNYTTGPILWGSAGTMGQHSFHQLLHQGTLFCPVDFILPLTTHTGMGEAHRRLVANCLAQSRTLMVGRTLAEARVALEEKGMEAEEADRLAPHLVMPGNRPSSIVSMRSLSPGTLGALLALYEHKTFCSGQLWGINPFDQWGVELGKEIGASVFAGLQGSADPGELDAATQRLMQAWRDAQD